MKFENKIIIIRSDGSYVDLYANEVKDFPYNFQYVETINGMRAYKLKTNKPKLEIVK